MPYLGDYLGHLASEITIARMQADLEAVRVAELYASHPLLRHLSIPRVTLPKVELDLPVVINKMEEPQAGESARGAVDVTLLRKEFSKLLTKSFRRERVELTPEDREKIKASLDNTIERFARPAETAIDVSRLAKDMTKAVFEALGAPARPGGAMERERARILAVELENLATVEFLKLRKPPPRLGVLVTTNEIRDAGPNEAITHIRVTITEHAMEWTRIDSDGDQEHRLVPE